MDDRSTRHGMPFNLDDLIHRRAIEGDRVEFKATWNHPIEAAVVKTVCAFANDLLNLNGNGGYIALGVEEEAGRPVLPPRGLDDLDLDRVQKEVFGACHRITPDYRPLLFPGDYRGRTPRPGTAGSANSPRSFAWLNPEGRASPRSGGS